MVLEGEAQHTNLIQHLVTLIKDEDLAISKAEMLVSDQSV